jgi:membrane protease YdiL (CAAX protease family)
MTATIERAYPDRTQANNPTTEPAVSIKQYSRRGIFAIWAAAAVPMAVLSWIVAPVVASNSDASLTRALIVCLTGGLVWQGALVAGLIGYEQRSLRWSRVRDALWLRAPRNPRTGRVGGRTWLIVPVLVLGVAVEELIPSLPHPAARDFGEFLSSHAGKAMFHGSWGWFAVVMTMFVFNTVLGEELLFRGVLLPRMHGAFGDRDWLVNGVLFAGYHIHVPWVIPATLLDTFVIAYPVKRYRSAWIGIVVHSVQSVVFTVLVLTLVF